MPEPHIITGILFAIVVMARIFFVYQLMQSFYLIKDINKKHSVYFVIASAIYLMYISASSISLEEVGILRTLAICMLPILLYLVNHNFSYVVNILNKIKGEKQHV